MAKRIVFILLAVCCLSLELAAQNFTKELKQQRANIEAAYKKKRLTEKEYNKLLAEQDVIKYAIEKYNSDGYFSPEEKNRIASKLQRATNRLRRYQNNNERY